MFIHILTERYPNHKFYTISKGIKGYDKENLKVFSNPYFFRVLKKFQLEKYLANRYDLVVSIGGSMYMENNDSNRDFSLGKNKRYILGSNFGPYKTEEYYKNIYGLFEKAEDVCFREKYSYDLFSTLPNVRYASDIVFSMNTDDIKITDRKRAVISVISCEHKIDKKYTEIYERKMLDLIENLASKDYEICLMSFCEVEKDEETIESMLQKCDNTIKNKIQTYYYNGNIKEALNVIGDSQIVVGSRFHANIIGLLLGKTVIPVLYSDKTKHVLDDMNLPIETIDIRQMQDIDIPTFVDKNLDKHFDVEKQKTDARRHFENLDKVLGVGK